MSQPASILLIDDHPMLRNGVKQLINLSPELSVIGEANDGLSGVELAIALDPDLILLDLNMQGMSGFETLIQLRQKSVTSRIIIFTVSDEEQDIINALKLGADSYLLKDMEPEDLLNALHQAAAGKMVMNEMISSIILASLRHKSVPDSDRSLSVLTPREREVLHFLAQGLSNKLIAREMQIVDSTVKVHVKNILKKLHFKSRVEIAVWYLQDKRHVSLS